MKSILWCCGLFIMVGPSLFGQTDKREFQHYTSKDGLSQNTVNCILQDSYGYMWFGTRDGLNKFDGYNFTVYKNDALDAKSISYNYVQDIIEDNNKNLWVGTLGKGLVRFNRNEENFSIFQ